MGRGPGAELTGTGAVELVDMVAHVDWDTDGASLVGDRVCNRLADPPGGIGAEFITALVVELLGGTDQADIAFLDQVKEGYAASHIFFGNTDHQAGVGCNQVLARAQPSSMDLRSSIRRRGKTLPRPVLPGPSARARCAGPANFFCRCQQRDLADFFEI